METLPFPDSSFDLVFFWHALHESQDLVKTLSEAYRCGRTSFVIAHRLSTIQRANRIVVLQNGQIVEVGTHAELLVQGGLYERLWSLQFANIEEA